ncbi:sn-glycerol-1-phosphate dehydrogenase [Flaviflexus huanghaiensis]|uniref:sn-glycerol-1-phosphate dehydrogenase n=1 Tax=Flaviflexus huanghaiensis TaxID=1111473 RepID=UPI0015FD0732|nr:sn-glycerol-1-phosphate dehydrogenase [Flaviflexus huanghaiensis]
MTTDAANEIAQGTELLDKVLERTPTTRVVSFGYDTALNLGALIREHHGPRSVVCVADETTWAAAGDRVGQSLSSLDQVNRIILPARPRPYANIDLVHQVRDALAQTPGALPIAVGSGTINDAVKLAAAELETPYWVVGSAPSMDGYTAAGASISKDGFKQNLACAAPYGVIMDLHILKTAPQIMWASGFGDMIGKISAIADWRIADVVGVEPVDPWVRELAERSALNALSDPSGVGARAESALPSLTVGLLMSGLSIQAYNSSRPGSGAEHMFSHLWEMEHVGLDFDPPLSHGAKVGIGSVAVAALYDELLQLDLTAMNIPERVSHWPSIEEALERVDALHSTEALRNVAASQLPKKHPEPHELERRLRAAVAAWPSLRAELRRLMKPADEIRDSLVKAGAHHHPHQVGLNKDRIRVDYLRLRSTRERYTSFDLAEETGVLPDIVSTMFGPGGIWNEWPDEIR